MAAGTVVIAPGGTRSTTGSVTLVAKGSNGSLTDFGPAVFLVTGNASTSYAITLPQSASTLTYLTNTMTVDTWTGSAASLTTSAQGESNFKVGGTLHVGANQTGGTYTGSFDVTVAYN